MHSARPRTERTDVLRSAAPGGGIITSSHAVSWDHVGLTADLVRPRAILLGRMRTLTHRAVGLRQGKWHHVAMVYDGPCLQPPT